MLQGQPEAVGRVAVSELLEVVRDPPDPYVAAEALRSLVAIQGPERLRVLLEEMAAEESFLIAGVAQETLSKLGR